MVTKYEITINGKLYVVEVDDISTSPAQVVVNGEPRMVEFREVGAAATAAAPAPAPEPRPKPQPVPQAEPPPVPRAEPAPVVKAPVAAQGTPIGAPMPGKILSIKVEVGDKVASGDIVCTLEAMKMEMPISATAGGTVQAVHVQVGDTVPYDAPLVTIG